MTYLISICKWPKDRNVRSRDTGAKGEILEEKQFSLEETLELSANMAAPDKILYCKLCPVVTEQKIMADKLIFRGDCVLHLLYLGNDGQLYRWNGNVPFSQYAELDRDCSDHAEPVIELAVTNLDLEKNTEGKLHLKAGILGQFMICDRENVSIVEDVYSPRRQIAIQTESVTLPSLLDAVEETVKAQISTEDMGDVVADVQFYPDIPQMYRDRDGVHCELTGVFSVLDRDMEGNFQNLVRSWSENKTLQADDNVKLDIQMKPALVGVRGDIMEADVPVTIRYWAETALPMVTEVEMGEPQDPDPNRPTLVLRRKGEQSLWELAKETGSTVERIQDANGLVGEPDSAKMLLIPVL